MLEARLDGREITSRERLHEQLQGQLRLPVWYGRNLDALHDCLTDLHEETRIVLLHREALEENLGHHAGRLLEVLRRAEAENPMLSLLSE